jgi:hypothetical protein
MEKKARELSPATSPPYPPSEALHEENLERLCMKRFLEDQHGKKVSHSPPLKVLKSEEILNDGESQDQEDQVQREEQLSLTEEDKVSFSFVTLHHSSISRIYGNLVGVMLENI